MVRTSWRQLGFENQVGTRLGKEPLLSLQGMSVLLEKGL